MKDEIVFLQKFALFGLSISLFLLFVMMFPSLFFFTRDHVVGPFVQDVVEIVVADNTIGDISFVDKVEKCPDVRRSIVVSNNTKTDSLSSYNRFSDPLFWYYYYHSWR